MMTTPGFGWGFSSIRMRIIQERHSGGYMDAEIVPPAKPLTETEILMLELVGALQSEGGGPIGKSAAYDALKIFRANAFRALLVPEEIEILEDLANVAGKIARVCNHDGPYPFDWAEAADKIHQLQHMIMSQAAVRAFPDKFRPLGKSSLDEH